jgi:hypothetical protein
MIRAQPHKQIARRDRRSTPLAAARLRGSEQRGTALVELALILPVLLLILFGIAEFALSLNSANDETHLANEVARYATVNEDPAPRGVSLQEWAKQQIDSNWMTGESVCISFPSGTNIGNPVKVRVTGKVNWLRIPKFSPPTTELVGEAVMRLEAPPSNYQAGCA